MFGCGEDRFRNKRCSFQINSMFQSFLETTTATSCEAQTWHSIMTQMQNSCCLATPILFLHHGLP
uniref:Uncharacterized protein n=1 Tax=Setaria italica TaxID=4555 RepID=K3ZKV4_SETIT